MAFDSLVVAFEKDGHFHHVELDDTWPVFDTSSTSPEWLLSRGTEWVDQSGVESVFRRFENAGYEIVSAVVHYDEFWSEETVQKHNIPNATQLAYLYERLSDDLYRTNEILAFLKLNDFANLSEWSDAIMYEGDSRSELAQAWFEAYHPELELPCELNVDWEATLDDIVSNNGGTVVYLNGTYYLFG